MSDNYNDKDIEKLIFGSGLAPGAIEPSEKFWNKAYEDILQRENRTHINHISRWRAAFFTAGMAALLLGAYVIYMHSEVSDIKQQLTTIENTRINTIEQNANQHTLINTNENSSIKNDLTSTSLKKNIQQPNEATAITSVTTKSTITVRKSSSRPHSGYNTSFSNIPATTTAQISTTSNLNTTQPIANSLTPIANKETTSAPINNKITTPTANANTLQTTNNNLPPEITPTQGSSTKITNTSLANKKTDSAMTASSLDSINSVYIPKKPITLRGIITKTSIAAFYAPGVTNDFLNDRNNDPTNTITAHELKTQEDGDGTFAIGLHLAYEISDKWTIQTGCYYSQYTYNINPTIIYPQQEENGQLGYSIATSSGTIFLPNSAVPAHLGDSIKVKGSSTRGYISIPLQAKYKFLAGTKFNLYADGGFSVNIADYKETKIHWNNTALQEGDLSVQSIYGLNTVQYSYNFGFGAAYLIGKGLSIYTEPFMDGSFTSINKNTPVITYPYFFGLAFGLTYHF